MDEATLAERLGFEIRRARKRQGLRLQDLEDRTGISNGHLSNIEAGRKVPRIDNLVRLAAALGLRPGELLDQAAVASIERDTPPYLTSHQAA